MRFACSTKYLRITQFCSSLLSPQSFSVSHLSLVSTQFPFAQVKSPVLQVCATGAEIK